MTILSPTDLMRDQWYGDNRDLAKWGILLTLANKLSLRHILQVLYYRPNDWPVLDVGGVASELPESVVTHFRNVHSITSMKAAVPIEVVADTFINRMDYLNALLQRIHARPQEHRPGLVFLDPDTGLAPKTFNYNHVMDSELAAVWRALGHDDVLVFYQHKTNRSSQPWVPEKKQQFERALGLPDGSAEVARATNIAHDVVFFHARRAVG